MLTLPLSETSLNNTEISYFIKALLGVKESGEEVKCNRRALFAVLLYLQNDEEFFRFIEAFAGRTIKIPSKQHISFIARNAKAYSHYLSQGRESAIEKFNLDDDKLDKIIRYGELQDVRPN